MQHIDEEDSCNDLDLSMLYNIMVDQAMQSPRLQFQPIDLHKYQDVPDFGCGFLSSSSRKNKITALKKVTIQIVLLLRQTPFDMKFTEVSNLMVQRLMDRQLHQHMTKSDQINLKRRCYDSLNILIAAQICQKDGRKCRLTESGIRQTQLINCFQKYQNQKKMLRDKITQKRAKFQQFRLRYLAMIFLQYRNCLRQNDQEEEVKLKFPLFSIVAERPKFESLARTMLISFRNSTQQRHLFDESERKIRSEVELIEKLQLQEGFLTRDQKLDLIPSGVRDYFTDLITD